jgi:O-antigen/teichoic acid export membrane protein
VVSVIDVALGVVAAFFGIVAVLVSRALVRTVAVAAAIVRWLRAGHARGEDPARDFASTAAPLLGFAWPALVSAALVLAAQTLLRLFLVRHSGLESAGQFQVADSIAQGLALVPGAASAAYTRSVASTQASGFAGLSGSLRRGLEQISGFNLPLCLVVMGVVPWATAALFGSEFAAARPVLVLLAAGYGLLGPCSVFAAAVFGRGEAWTGASLSLVWAVAVLGVYTFAGAPMGAVGAALAVVAGYVAFLFVCLAVVAPRWSVPVWSLLPSVLVTALCLATGCGLGLSPRIPALVTGAVCLTLGIVVLTRWGLPTLRAVTGPDARTS